MWLGGASYTVGFLFLSLANSIPSVFIGLGVMVLCFVLAVVWTPRKAKRRRAYSPAAWETAARASGWQHWAETSPPADIKFETVSWEFLPSHDVHGAPIVNGVWWRECRQPELCGGCSMGCWPDELPDRPFGEPPQ